MAPKIRKEKSLKSKSSETKEKLLMPSTMKLQLFLTAVEKLFLRNTNCLITTNVCFVGANCWHLISEWPIVREVSMQSRPQVCLKFYKTFSSTP